MTLRHAMTLLAAVVLLTLISITAYAWTSGVRAYAIDSGSMAPAFNTGALVIDLPTTRATVFHVGDVVTFNPTPQYTATHRIASIGPDGISTKGDANRSSDVGFIQPGMIVGRVAVAIPYVGYVAVFFQHPIGVLGLLLLGFALLAVWHLTASAPKARHATPAIDERSS